MFPSFTPAAEFEAKLEATERKLLEIAKGFATQPVENFEFRTFDTHIPRSAIPCLKPAKSIRDEKLKIHSIHAYSKLPEGDASTMESTTVPLINLHGYMNAGAYFYRNLAGLVGYYRNVYSVDMLGFGLSSRPPFNEVNDNENIESAEDYFVESLEAWRAVNNIDKMILGGHSFGGYVAVAYAERYPQHVDKIILLSPLGVNDKDDPNIRQKMEWIKSSLKGKALFKVFKTVFERKTTPGGVLRKLTAKRGMSIARKYVKKRLPEISNPEESETLSHLLYLNAVLPPSAEFFLQTILDSTLQAKKPLLFRVPNLKVKTVAFMYGTSDWMEVSGGMYAQALSDRLSKRLDGPQSQAYIPNVDVYLVPNCGHLLILQNPDLVNKCVISIGGGTVFDDEVPTPMDLNETEELSDSWMEQTMKIRAETISCEGY